MIDTPGKLLDAAERLFATQGYGAVSLRQVIAEAEVNVAAVHYHFGSKEELLDQVVMRKAGPVNQERMARLEKVETESSGRPEVEQVLEAFLAPMGETAAKNPQFAKMMGRLQAEGILSEVISRNFQPVLTRFMVALRKCAPHLADNEFRWRVHFMQGAIAYTMGNDPSPVSGAVDDGYPARLARLVTFLGAGLRAPEPGVKKSGKNK